MQSNDQQMPSCLLFRDIDPFGSGGGGVGGGGVLNESTHLTVGATLAGETMTQSVRLRGLAPTQTRCFVKNSVHSAKCSGVDREKNFINSIFPTLFECCT